LHASWPACGNAISEKDGRPLRSPTPVGRPIGAASKLVTKPSTSPRG
jgi:hypothetical protein